MEPVNQKEAGQEVTKLSQVIQINEGRFRCTWENWLAASGRDAQRPARRRRRLSLPRAKGKLS